jgi:hypothetical protein
MKKPEYKIPAALVDNLLDILRAVEERGGSMNIFQPTEKIEQLEKLITDQDAE